MTQNWGNLFGIRLEPPPLYLIKHNVSSVHGCKEGHGSHHYHMIATSGWVKVKRWNMMSHAAWQYGSLMPHFTGQSMTKNRPVMHSL